MLVCALVRWHGPRVITDSLALALPAAEKMPLATVQWAELEKLPLREVLML